MTFAKKQDQIGKDLGNVYSKICQGNADKRANELEHVGAIQESTSRSRAALMELVDGLPQGNPPAGSENSVGTNDAVWKSVIPERTTWE